MEGRPVAPYLLTSFVEIYKSKNHLQNPHVTSIAGDVKNILFQRFPSSAEA